MTRKYITTCGNHCGVVREKHARRELAGLASRIQDETCVVQDLDLRQQISIWVDEIEKARKLLVQERPLTIAELLGPASEFVFQENQSQFNLKFEMSNLK